MVWQDYRADAVSLEQQELGESCSSDVRQTIYGFTALRDEEGEIRAVAKVFTPLTHDAEHTVLIVPEYHKDPDYHLIMELVKMGYRVVSPNLSGEGAACTVYEGKYAYGRYVNAGERLKKVCPTAKDTCQYLYTVIIRRTMQLIEEEGFAPFVVIGLSDAVEVAMAACATGKNALALAAFNGSGYREYIRLNKYGEGRELELDEERVAWLTGVASVAYAKFLDCPFFLSIGTNSTKSDPDRVSNLLALLGSNRVHVVFSPRVADYLNPAAFRSFEIWLSGIFHETPLPECPDLEIRVAEDGKLYFEAHCDVSAMIQGVSIYYSYGDYQHGVRDWLELEGESISADSFLASPQYYDETGPLFAYAEVRYLTGLTLSSTVEYVFLGGKRVHEGERESYRVIFNAEEEATSFIEEYTGDVLVESGISTVVSPYGVKGITTRYDALTTYHFHPQTMQESNLLQLDFLSEGAGKIEVTLECVEEDNVKRYVVRDEIGQTQGMFVSRRYRVQDFKDERFLPLRSWKSARSLSVKGQAVAVGSIIMI